MKPLPLNSDPLTSEDYVAQFVELDNRSGAIMEPGHWGHRLLYTEGVGDDDAEWRRTLYKPYEAMRKKLTKAGFKVKILMRRALPGERVHDPRK